MGSFPETYPKYRTSEESLPVEPGKATRVFPPPPWLFMYDPMKCPETPVPCRACSTGPHVVVAVVSVVAVVCVVSVVSVVSVVGVVGVVGVVSVVAVVSVVSVVAVVSVVVVRAVVLHILHLLQLLHLVADPGEGPGGPAPLIF